MPSRSPRGGVVAIVVMVVFVAAFVVAPTALGLSYQLLRHTSCSIGMTAGEVKLWTPVTLLDSPTNTSSPEVYAMSSGSAPNEAPGYLILTGGEAAGVFSLDTWALYDVTQTWAWGPGSVHQCPSYQVSDLSREPGGLGGSEESTVVLAPQGSVSDAGLPIQVNVSTATGVVYPSVYFFANFNGSQGSPSGLTVGGGGVSTISFSEVGATVFVLVPFLLPDGTVSLFPGWMEGVESWLYVFAGPYNGCVAWVNEVNPLGTGLVFGTPVATSPSGC